MNNSPWEKPISLPWFRAGWVFFSLLVLPSLLFQAGVPSVYLPFCGTAAALPVCIASPGTLGLKMPEWGDVAAAIAGYMTIILLAIMVTPLWEKLLKYLRIPYSDKQDLAELLAQCDSKHICLLFFSVCILTPFVEEVLFRRIIFGELAKIDKGLSLLITSLIFAACHFFIFGFPQLFIMGIFFQLIYLCRENLSAAIILHVIVNSCAFAKNIIGG